ncbi:MAG: SPOR domain-containing protein [Fibromonadales bacterium]|nr:SPOR domain-containing protein [Fibromonadales bacterium]
MKKLFVFSMLAFSMFFFACEEEVIPIPLPPPAQAAGNEAAPPAEEKAEPQVVAEKPSEPPAKPVKSSVKEAPIKEPAAKAVTYFSGDAEQLSKGRYVIQISIFPMESSARKLIKKLADNGIKAYNAKVDNPDPEKGMIGTYNRVRIGFFDAKPSAEAFAKSRLEPLGYSWWVDRSRNDNIGKLTYSEPEPVFEVERLEQPKKMSEQERRDAERAAAIAAAKEEYKAIAKAANASVSNAAVPPPKIPAKSEPQPPVIKAPAPKAAAAPAPKAAPATKAAPASKNAPPATSKSSKSKNPEKEAEIDSRGRVKMKSRR